MSKKERVPGASQHLTSGGDALSSRRGVMLKDVCSLSKGAQIDGKELSDEFTVPFLNGGINPSGRWKEANVDANSVAISEGGNSCGYVNYMTTPFWCGAHCYYLYDLKCDSKYLYHALKAKQKEIMSLRTGVCMPNIKKSSLAEFGFFYHDSLPAQRAIAEELDRICELKRTAEKLVEKYQLLVKSRFVEMFGDVVINDRAWAKVRFDEVTTSRLGKMLDAKQQTGKNKHKYLANFNVQWFRIDASELHEMDFDEADQKEFELKDGDLLVCEGGESGRSCVWRNQVKPYLFTVRP